MSGMDPRLIKEISSKIGTEFNMLRIYLGFTEAQLARLKSAHRNLGDQIHTMLKEWHDVVVRCGENPRHLLAAALQDCENRYLAVTKLVTGAELDGLKCREPKAQTKQQIKEIIFSTPGDMDVSRNVNNYGASNAVNVFPGASLSIQGSLFLPSGCSAPRTSYSGPKPGDLKKSYDNSLSQKMMGIYHKMMESVGVIMVFNHMCGTGFRVGSRFIMTAYHVVQGILDPDQSGVQTPSKLEQSYINFSDNPHDPSPMRYRFTSNVVYTDFVFDIAVLEISHRDGKLPPRLPLRKEKLPAFSPLEYVALIGYGTPNKPEKNFESHCPVVNPDSPCVISALAKMLQNYQDLTNNLQPGIDKRVLDMGYHGYDEPYKILIHTFMEGGASGSPLLACVNKLEGTVQVVGVLTHGIPEFYFCLSKKGKEIMEDNCRFEAGPRMACIYDNMLTSNNALANEIFT